MLGQIFHGINPPSRDASMSPPPVFDVSSNRSNGSPIMSDHKVAQPAAGRPDESNLYWVVSDKRPVALQPDKPAAGGSGIYELLTGELPQRNSNTSSSRQLSSDPDSLHTKQLQREERVDCTNGVNKPVQPQAVTVRVSSQPTQPPSSSVSYYFMLLWFCLSLPF